MHRCSERNFPRFCFPQVICTQPKGKIALSLLLLAACALVSHQSSPDLPSAGTTNSTFAILGKQTQQEAVAVTEQLAFVLEVLGGYYEESVCK
ncbi:hypothetical protein [Chroococcidiopsis cubana]|uniref:hypothetical protein n=1 Tax=Chroococcidiopsis cubana TaxID=171392 RepID=UPI0011B231D7|nr:hypothetical protein [Chroococcidiopsis cubana]